MVVADMNGLCMGCEWRRRVAASASRRQPPAACRQPPLHSATPRCSLPVLASSSLAPVFLCVVLRHSAACGPLRLRLARLLVRLGHSGGGQQRPRAGAGGRGVAPLRRRRAARRASAGGEQVGARDSATTGTEGDAMPSEAMRSGPDRTAARPSEAREAERQRSARQATLIMQPMRLSIFLPACRLPCSIQRYPHQSHRRLHDGHRALVEPQGSAAATAAAGAGAGRR